MYACGQALELNWRPTRLGLQDLPDGLLAPTVAYAQIPSEGLHMMEAGSRFDVGLTREDVDQEDHVRGSRDAVFGRFGGCVIRDV